MAKCKKIVDYDGFDSNTKLPQGGYYDVDFIEPPPDSLQCPICLLALKQPHILSCCGSHMCENCLGHIKTSGQPCPCCRESEYTSLLDKRTRGKILGLRVRCSKDGCDWEGELGDLERHFAEKCFYSKEVCPYGCGQSYPRHLLQEHQLDECPQRPLEAKFESLQRQFAQYRLQQQKLMKRLAQQEKKHEEDKMELQQQLAQQEKKLAEQEAVTLAAPSWLRPTINIPNSVVPCFVAMSNFAQLKMHKEAWNSPPFYVSQGYRMRIIVHANGVGSGAGTHVSVSIQLIEGDYDDVLTWPYTGTVTYEIINWREDGCHVDMTLPFCSNSAIAGGYGKKPTGDNSNTPWGYPQALPYDKAYRSTYNCQYVNNDLLYIRVSRSDA